MNGKWPNKENLLRSIETVMNALILNLSKLIKLYTKYISFIYNYLIVNKNNKHLVVK